MHPHPAPSDTRYYDDPAKYGFKNDGRHDPKIPLIYGIRFQVPLILLALLGIVLIFSALPSQ
jgi:hypothetical protein